MNLKIKLKKFFTDRFTLLIVPHNSTKTKQIKAYKYIITTTITLFIATFIFFVVSSLYLFKENTYLQEEIFIKDDKINSLSLVVKNQNLEIEELKNTSKIVMDKLSQLYSLENKVRDMVGLTPSESDSENPPASRSLIRDLDFSLNDDLSVSTEDLSEESMETITNMIELEKDNYDNLIKEVEDQLKFLESKPDMWPVSGTITSKFGYRIHPISKTRQFHKGLDIANDSGTDIMAAGSGIVTYSGWNGGYGRVIIISHGYGYKTVYAHNQQNLVKVGDKVKKGEVIAKLGSSGVSTGPHVHFEVIFNGNQIDPLEILSDK